MEITILPGRLSPDEFISAWTRRHGPVERIKMARGLIVEIDDEDEAQEMIDELDRLGMNYEKD